MTCSISEERAGLGRWCIQTSAAKAGLRESVKSHYAAGINRIGSSVSTFGYHPGQIDYWLFITDWHFLVVVAAALTVTSARPWRPDDTFRNHANPAIGQSAGDR